jgi:4-hydroxy-tetrahydrodipicolinate synthase
MTSTGRVDGMQRSAKIAHPETEMTNQIAKSVQAKLTGILPPITMPFDQDGNLVPSGLKAQIDLMIASGVRAIVAGGSTGEGHTLARDEFAAAMKASHDAIAGRVPFVVGLIVNSTKEAVERFELIKGLNITALQVTPVHYLFKPQLDATIAHFRTIWEKTKTPILIYNVIPWNYLSPKDMLAIMDSVPGVVGIKQSSGDLKSLSDLLLDAKPENVILSGIDALLYSAFALGGHGAISALTSALPGVCVRLFNAVAKGDHQTGKDIHFKLNALWNAMRHDNLPACAKYIQSRQGLPMFYPRPPMECVTDQQKREIDKYLAPLLAL